MAVHDKGEHYPREIGRYLLFAPIAQGGMGTVHLGRALGAAGFARTVAIKRLRTGDGVNAEHEFVTMLLDEARIASRIRHTNVVAPLDVVAQGADLLLVMEYVEGETLARLASSGPIPVPIAAAMVVGALRGLHAAHEAKSERGRSLDIVHRDVSPQNILVGVDGVARIVDFGIAKAAVRLQVTRDGSVKGKIAYMAPEQIRREGVDRRVDVYAASVVLWEALVGERLFRRERVADTIQAIVSDRLEAPSARVANIPPAVDAVVMRGLERVVDMRYATAAEMADALEQATEPANTSEVAKWVVEHAKSALSERARLVEEIEGMSAVQALDSPGEPAPRAEAASAAAPVMRAPAPRGPARARTVIVGVLMVALIAAVWVGRRSRGGEAKVTVASSAVPSASASERAVPAVAPTIPEPLATSPAHAPPSASASASGASSAPATSHAAASVKRPRERPAPRSCDPPFLVDSTGVKIPKRECLQ